MVGNVIVKFEKFPTLSFKVFAPTKKFIFKKSIAHPHVARNNAHHLNLTATSGLQPAGVQHSDC